MAGTTLTKDQALELHLTGPHMIGGHSVFSGFMAALRDAREATGRDADTGAKIPGRSYGSWLGALGYFALLDQIGSCFRPQGVADSGDNSFTKALKLFTSLSSDEVDALYALRCAFAHDFALSNKGSRPSLTHHFLVGIGPAQVVRPASVPWNGDYSNLTVSNQTFVSLEAFGDLVEDVVNTLRMAATAGQLDVILPDGIDELLGRYAFSTGV